MSWKQSKLFIAVSSSVGTTLFLLTIFFTVIIPTWIESYRNEIKELRNVIPKYPQIVKDLKEKESAIVELKTELNAIRLENIFVQNNIYPAGYRQIIIGDPLSKVRTVYSEDLISRIEDRQDAEILKVKIDHRLFCFIAYCSTGKGGEIDYIGFQFNDPSDIVYYEILKKKIKETFPSVKYSEPVSNKLFLVKNLNGLDIRLDRFAMTLYKR